MEFQQRHQLPEQPKIAAVVAPTDGALPATWDIADGCNTKSAVDTVLVIGRAATAHPSPFSGLSLGGAVMKRVGVTIKAAAKQRSTSA